MFGKKHIHVNAILAARSRQLTAAMHIGIRIEYRQSIRRYVLVEDTTVEACERLFNLGDTQPGPVVYAPHSISSVNESVLYIDRLLKAKDASKSLMTIYDTILEERKQDARRMPAPSEALVLFNPYKDSAVP